MILIKVKTQTRKEIVGFVLLAKWRTDSSAIPLAVSHEMYFEHLKNERHKFDKIKKIIGVATSFIHQTLKLHSWTKETTSFNKFVPKMCCLRLQQNNCRNVLVNMWIYTHVHLLTIYAPCIILGIHPCTWFQ